MLGLNTTDSSLHDGIDIVYSKIFYSPHHEAQSREQCLLKVAEYLSSGVLIPGSGAGSSQDSGGNDWQLDAVSKWIDENVISTGLQEDDDKVARLVMRCVLNSAVPDGEEPSAKLINAQIIRCNKLLKKVTNSTEAPKRLVKQAGCLYEVQAFCGTKGWPSGLMKKLFYNLYETDIVFEDAYGVWREDVNDTTPGKDKALFQVNEFLQWLDVSGHAPHAHSASLAHQHSF